MTKEGLKKITLKSDPPGAIFKALFFQKEAFFGSTKKRQKIDGSEVQ